MLKSMPGRSVECTFVAMSAAFFHAFLMKNFFYSFFQQKSKKLIVFLKPNGYYKFRISLKIFQIFTTKLQNLPQKIMSTNRFANTLRVGMIFISRLTKLRHFKTKKGVSKKHEYLQIEGVPVIVRSLLKTDEILMMLAHYERFHGMSSGTATLGQVASSSLGVAGWMADYQRRGQIAQPHDHPSFIELNSLTSATNRCFTITLSELEKEFTPAPINQDGNFPCPKYPGGMVNIAEFGQRDSFNKMKAKMEEKMKSIDDKVLKKVFADKLFQMIQSQGAPFIKTDEALAFIRGEVELTVHKRFGHEIFNRNCRWCPPIDISHEEFTQSPSYPCPLGIRPKDFCLPSELSRVVVEMTRQLLCFKNVDAKYKEEFDQLFNEFGFHDVFAHCQAHKCKYCGEEIDMSAYKSEYKSADNFIEICHRDPNSHFTTENMYWGHGECNRRQGGYTETDRIDDALRLLDANFADYSHKEKKIWANKMALFIAQYIDES